MKLMKLLICTFLFISYSCITKDQLCTESDMNLRMELFTTNVERSVTFYTKVLGFKMIGTEINKNYQPVRKGSVIIGIGPLSKLNENHPFNPNRKNVPKGYGVEIVLEVEDVQKIYDKVISTGYRIHEPLSIQSWGLQDFRVIDPDGYYLRITSKQ